MPLRSQEDPGLGEGRWNTVLVLAKPEGMPKASQGRDDCSMTSSFPPSWPQLQDPLFCEAALNPPGSVDFSLGSSCSVFSLSHCVVSPLDAQAKSMCHLSLYSHFTKHRAWLTGGSATG